MSLHYSFLNEDPHCEVALIPAHARTALAVAGGGFRCLILLRHPFLKMTIVDRDPAQIEHARRLFAQVSELTYAEFLKYWRPLAANSPLYEGKHERQRQAIARVIARARPPGVEAFKNPAQREFFYSSVDRVRFAGVQRLFAMALTLNGLKSNLGSRTVPPLRDDRGALGVCRELFDALLDDGPIADNFFLQQLLYGHAVTESAFSALLSEQDYAEIKSNLKNCEISFFNQSLDDALSSAHSDLYDFVSLSNVWSYLTDTAQTRLLRQVSHRLGHRGVVVVRTFLNHLCLTHAVGLAETTDKHAVTLKGERTHFYSIRVFEQSSGNVYFSREKKTYLPSPIPREHVIHWSYQSPLGRAVNRWITRPGFSRLYGAWADQKWSTRSIPGFTREFKIDPSIYESGPFANFNAFFLRRFLPGQRPFVTDPTTIAAPCEGYYLSPFADTAWIKGVFAKVGELLGISAREFEGQSVLIARLSPSEYHWIHAPVDGVITRIEHFSGDLHSINPVTLTYDPNVFLKNKRTLIQLDSPTFGSMRLLAIGATCVGRIGILVNVGQEVRRGDAIANFSVGGSTVILAGDAKLWKIADDLAEQSKSGYETFVQLGACIGNRV